MPDARKVHQKVASRLDPDPLSCVPADHGHYTPRSPQCVCAQYLLAVERLKSQGFAPRRSIHLSFVPDEEIGGSDGMAKFLATDVFKGLNVGLALDEGIANPGARCGLGQGKPRGNGVVELVEGIFMARVSTDEMGVPPWCCTPSRRCCYSCSSIPPRLMVVHRDWADDAYTFFYGERMPLWIRIRATGNTGHGSR